MSNEIENRRTWERGRPARIDHADRPAGETPGLPGVVRLTLGTNNLYALPSDAGITLIDAGPDYEGAWEELHAQLHAHGLDPARVHTILLTHHHLDHAGLAARWQAAGARILIGAPDAPALAMDTAAREHERALARRELLRHGVPPDALATRPGESAGGTGGAAPDRRGSGKGNQPSDRTDDGVGKGRTGSPIPSERYTRWAAPLRMTPVEPDGVLKDGACIGELHRLRAIACPGHTPGTLLFLNTTAGALFTGDHILPRMAPTSGIQFEGELRCPSLPTYLDSLRTTRALGPHTTAVYPGHGEPFTDLVQAVDWTVRLLEQRARRAIIQLRRGPATAYTLARRMFPHLGPRHLRPTMAEVIGLLDLLTERGLARADDHDTLVTWHALAPEHREGPALERSEGPAHGGEPPPPDP